MANITISLNGVTYQLLGEPYMVTHRHKTVYAAIAYITTDVPDKYNTVPAWLLIWNIREGRENPEDTINWGVPDEIEPYGGACNQAHVLLSTGRII